MDMLLWYLVGHFESSFRETQSCFPHRRWESLGYERDRISVIDNRLTATIRDYISVLGTNMRGYRRSHLVRGNLRPFKFIAMRWARMAVEISRNRFAVTGRRGRNAEGIDRAELRPSRSWLEWSCPSFLASFKPQFLRPNNKIPNVSSSTVWPIVKGLPLLRIIFNWNYRAFFATLQHAERVRGLSVPETKASWTSALAGSRRSRSIKAILTPRHPSTLSYKWKIWCSRTRTRGLLGYACVVTDCQYVYVCVYSACSVYNIILNGLVPMLKHVAEKRAPSALPV